MPDETKPTLPTPPGGGNKLGVEKPIGSVQTTSAAEKVSASPPPPEPATLSATPPKPAAAAGGHTPAAPVKPAGPAPIPCDSPMVATLKRQFGSGIGEASTYLGQNYMVVDRSLIPEILQVLRDQEQFDYCVDITAVHYPSREKPFDVVWILYSFARNERIRVKALIADGEALPSSVSIWATANWIEREVYDMFGIRFEGIPTSSEFCCRKGGRAIRCAKNTELFN